MPIHDKYYPGSTVSRHLSAGERSFREVVYQSGKPVLDSELNLDQEIRQQVRSLMSDRGIPSGFMRTQDRSDPHNDFAFGGGVDADEFALRKATVMVAGFPIVVEYSNAAIPGWNIVALEPAPLFGGAPPDIKRTDFVFLEVWQALVSNSANSTGTVTVLPGLPVDGDTVVLNGITLTARLAAPVVDEFLIGASPTLTASNIATAINAPANSFDTFLSASSAGAVVTIRSVVSGAAGDLITLVVTGVALVRSAPTLLGGVDEIGKPTQDTLYRHGNVLADPSVNLPDDIADPVIGTETAKRVQVQYRIRHTGQSEAVSFKSEPDGFSNAAVLAQGNTASPVVSYPFVKADNASGAGLSDATAYGYKDAGLWVAGDGSSTAAAALNSLDGFVYAVPVAFLFRRNNAYNAGAGAGWDPLINTNGALPSTHPLFANPSVGSIPIDTSDRPDGAFHDRFLESDLQDLRYHVSAAGVDLMAELQFQIQSLLDGVNRTWAIDAADKNTLGAGSGDVGTQFLVCNQIGRDAGHGGTAPASGSTTRGDTIRNFDHLSRRFADQPVNEIIVFEVFPTTDSVSQPGRFVARAGYAGAYGGWAEDDTININLASINASTPGDFDHAKRTFFGSASIMDFAPPGTTIVDVRSVRHDEGHFAVAVSQACQVKAIGGLGTPHIAITLDLNTDVVNGGDTAAPDHPMVGDSGGDDGSARRIFVELEVSYPLGSGTTDTPDVEVVPDPLVWVDGPVLENTTAQRPDDWDGITPPRFREGFREVVQEYIAGDPNAGAHSSGLVITDSIVSRDTSSLRFPRRVFGSAARVVGVTDTGGGFGDPHNVDEGGTNFGSSSREVVLVTGGGVIADQALSGPGQTLCTVTYFAQDPVPNWGSAGGGYQVGVYYRSNAPQTLGVQAGPMPDLPDPLHLTPLATLDQVYSGQVGMGSVDLAFPYASPLEQIPVNDNGDATFPAEWYFAATADISVADFNVNTGMLNLHSFVPMDGTTELEFVGKAKDAEFRAFFGGIGQGYRPTAFAQDLSNVTRHKNWTAMLVRANDDTDLFRENEVLLVIISRFAELDSHNTVGVTDIDNRTCAAIYRTRNRLVLVSD